MEEMDWAKKPLPTSLWAELVEMGSEIFFLARVRHYNPYGMWIFSMAMHWGVYLLFGWIFLLVIEALFKITALSQITNIVGIVAFISGAFGCLALITKRATNKELSLYTAPVDYFNLLFMLSIFGTGILSWITDSSLINSRKYVDGLIFFNLSDVPPIVILNFVLFGLFLIYMPFTKLLHYLAKYFNFHQSLWDDAFKAKDSPKDKKNVEEVGYKFFWAGPHVNPDKTWLENAMDLRLEEKKK
jgi:nitrate reductase gamma subunit